MNSTYIEAYKEGCVKLSVEELPELGKGDVLLHCVYSAISPGTEVAWVYHLANTPGKYPYKPGYSACCRVEAVGEEVTNLAVGDLVVANITHCKYAVVPAAKVSRLPEGVDPLEASVYRLASISLQGVRKADIQIGDDVAVIGLGAIGNLAAQIAYVAGAGTVTCFDPVDWRREVAADCGLQDLEADSGAEAFQNRYDVVFEATGVPAVVNTALQMVKPLGKVILLGSTRGLTDGVNFYRDVHRKGIVVIGAHEMHRSRDEADRFGHFRSGMEDERTIVKLLASGRIKMAPLISQVVMPQSAQEIYDKLYNREGRLMVASFDWKETD